MTARRIDVLVDEAIEVISDAQSDLGSDLQGLSVRDLLLDCFPEHQSWEIDEALEILRARNALDDMNRPIPSLLQRQAE